MNRKSSALAWGLLFPTLAVLALFVLYPAAQSFWLSFQDVEPFSKRSFFVGFENYQVLFNSPDYWQTVRVTLFFLLYTVIPSLVISLTVAVLLDANPFFQNMFRTLFLLPVAISSSMAAMLWIFIYNPTAGFLNYALDVLGIHGPNWLADPDWALVAVAVATVWKEIGFNIIFFLAGLTSIPLELKEAAELDGANSWQVFRYVTLPLLSPTLFFVSVVSVINSLQSFGQIHILTTGGPMGETTTLVYNLYRDAFVKFRTGLASSEAVILFGLILLATMVQFRMAKKRVHYG
ncbi:MAG: sugar ABC transporter permease [Deltaproteobacteria bacterium]|nr:sugar ABC transporter permease [Deltaproteobacteria bacterium]